MSLIALDVATNGGSHAQPSLTFAHTITGANPILFVVAWSDTAADDITGATYNGVAMTLIGQCHDTGGVAYHGYLFMLQAPATGTNNVVISGTGGTIYGGAVSYTGAAQSGQPDQSTTGSAAGSPFDLSVTTVADNCWTILLIASDSGTLAADGGTPTTSRLQVLANFFEVYDSNGPKTPAGSTSLGVTYVNHAPGGVMASFKPAGGPSIPVALSKIPFVNHTRPRPFAPGLAR